MLITKRTHMIDEANEPIFTFSNKPKLWFCPVHGEVTNWIEVKQNSEQDGVYCQRCYVVNVIAKHCCKLEPKEGAA